MSPDFTQLLSEGATPGARSLPAQAAAFPSVSCATLLVILSEECAEKPRLVLHCGASPTFFLCTPISPIYKILKIGAYDI